ncbi:hypothetical protein RvY_03591 [Ramazzottius varieornatus]|uniref:BK channel n=1 Tax=Ramazzottius varieornatus TaxID=947166 RepID=A0A1D1UNN0_RAMVA|nr:hypothetical protein RvY_03591 [Ramazzottius varieornatus]
MPKPKCSDVFMVYDTSREVFLSVSSWKGNLAVIASMDNLPYNESTALPVLVNDGNSSATPTGAVLRMLLYDEVECETKLWWAFLLSGVLSPVAILAGLGVWKLFAWFTHRRKKRTGYLAVNRVDPLSQSPSEKSIASHNGSVNYVLNGRGNTPRRSLTVGTLNEVPARNPAAFTLHQEPEESHWSAIIQQAATDIVSAQSLTGRVAVCVTFIVSMVSLGLYFVEVSNSHIPMYAYHEKCADWRYRTDWQLELVCSVFLLIDFFIRFVAANNKLKFMFSIYAIVDYFTVPPAFLVAFLDHHWTGLRFLRALYMLSIPDILQFSNILRTTSKIRLVQLVTLLSCVILVGAGFFHLFETYGDAHLDQSNAVERSYWEYVYFVVVTMSTLGYGDISPVTRLGRAFTVVFLFFAFTVFAACVPEMFRLFQNRQRYKDDYKDSYGNRHVVVAGDISTSAMDWFLNSFYSVERENNRNLHVVFVNRTDPDLEMEALLKRNITRVAYIKGSVLEKRDLILADVNGASAVLILSDKNAVNPTSEDAGSVMSVISVKNHSPATRCLVQLLQSRSVAHVANIPGFNAMAGDSIICFSTLELGLLAQSCLAPGFSTLISNLMGTDCTRTEQENEVVADYIHGTQMKILMEQLSDYFDGMTFLEAVKACAFKLSILLIGILQADNDRPSGTVLLNPRATIKAGHVGVFIARSTEEVTRAWFVCRSCHNDSAVDAKRIQFCGCDRRKAQPVQVAARDPQERFRTFAATDTSGFREKTLPKGWEKMVIRLIQKNPSATSLQKVESQGSKMEKVRTRVMASISEDVPAGDAEGASFTMEPEAAPLSPTLSDYSDDFLDITRAFYACPSRPFKNIVLNRSKAAKQLFNDHIVVLVLAGATDPPVGFLDFVLPLRSSKIEYADLKEIVFLGNPHFLEKEWYKISNLPKLTVVKGDPLDRADLRAVSIKTCAMCVVLPSRSGGSTDPILDDKDTILATLNIMAMSFEKIEVAAGASAAGRSRSTSTVNQLMFKRLAREGFEVPTISPLYQDVNVPLLEAYEAQKSNYTEVMLMEPYVCGYCLPLSALDSILIANFFNPYALELIKALLFGDMSTLTETLLTEGIGLVSGEIPASEPGRSANAQLRLISLLEPPLRHRLSAISTYNTLFSEACELGMVCLGLARRVYPNAMNSSRATKRCVITNPPPTYALRHDDLVYVLSS